MSGDSGAAGGGCSAAGGADFDGADKGVVGGAHTLLADATGVKLSSCRIDERVVSVRGRFSDGAAASAVLTAGVSAGGASLLYP